MIRFKGEYSEKCKLEKEQRTTKSVRNTLLLVFPFVLALGIVILIFCYSRELALLVPLTILGQVLAIACVLKVPKHAPSFPMTAHVTIDYDVIKSDRRVLKTKRLRRIIKTKNSYYLKFPFEVEVVCPRHLMVKGTEEEFEAMFPGKIVYKD